VTRLLDGRHHLERFAMEQAGEVDYLITWRDEFVGRVSLIRPIMRSVNWASAATRPTCAMPMLADRCAEVSAVLRTDR
jgi:hypothetical protein